MMTRQEIFNKAYTHAKGMKQLAKENDGKEFCRYLASNGERCLIGGFIAPEDYDPSVENNTVRTIFTPSESTEWKDYFIRIGLVSEEVSYDEISFLQDLQSCHDNAKNIHQMMDYLKFFSETRNLKIPD